VSCLIEMRDIIQSLKEFVDELVPTRTLKEELMSVFTEMRDIIPSLNDMCGMTH